MTDTLGNDVAAIRAAMDAAATTLDFEEAARLRNILSLMRHGTSRLDAEAAQTSLLTRQQPGAMGIGTSASRPERPAGWKRPRKPDSLTRNSSRKAR